ncbi:PDZ domain-containing protein [Luteimonas sp. Y-2-2-4F]|nr:PDZ domain-containing protein [Luteimonas sp. Y-2-2-4F]MCD9030568.1 PDZ domain-containing protein [Luteimonas sp. Y-2-2-4F]
MAGLLWAAAALPAAAGEGLEGAFPGYEVFGPVPASLEELDADPQYPLYLHAVSTLRMKRDCASAPQEREQTEQAFARMVASNQRHVSPAQWRALERVLAATMPADGVDRSPGAFQCEIARAGWPRFDAQVDELRLARDEARALEAWQRAGTPAAGGAIGVQMAPGLAAVVTGVVPGSPAQRAGLLPEDRILAIDGEAVATSDGVAYRIGQIRPGGTVRLRLRRDPRPERPDARVWEAEVEVVAAGTLRAEP